MLKFYRKNIKFIIWLIVLSFAIWGAGSISMSTNSAPTHVGFVGKEKISQTEFLITTRYFDLLNQSRTNPEQENEKVETQEAETAQDAQKSDTQEENQSQDTQAQDVQTENEAPTQESKSMTYDQIRGLAWQMIVLSREAKREGVDVTDEEVQNEIRRLFSQEGIFNQAFYEQWVQNNFRVQTREFEELIRKHLAADKLREHVLKDVPEEQRNSRWFEWFLPVMSKSEFKDWEKPAETPTSAA
jgi:hypothetical protein